MIGLDAKVHVGLFNRLHVAHKNNTKIEMIYNHIWHQRSIRHHLSLPEIELIRKKHTVVCSLSTELATLKKQGSRLTKQALILCSQVK